MVNSFAASRPRLSFWRDRLLWLVLVGSAAMLALTIPKPLGFDNAMYQRMGIDLHDFGRIPYIGSWDQNFPGIFYIHYLIISAFGPSDLSVRWFDCLVQ